MRISVVASAYARSSRSAETRGHLRSGCELQLVAGDARSGHLADDCRLDAEVGERLNEGLRRPLGRFRGLAACLAGAPEERTVREPVLGMWLRVVEEDVSGGFLRRRRLERRLVDLGGVVLGHELLEEQRNGPGRLVVRRTKDVSVGLHAVDGRR